jgi:hypothetical protein
VTKGSVTGLDRVIAIDGVKRRHLVQTDAAVTGGDSGAPLLSAETGAVVGLVDLVVTGAKDATFAVSADVAAPLLKAWAARTRPPLQAVCTNTRSGGDYFAAIDIALLDASLSPGGLGDLITAVNKRTLGPAGARSEINSVIGQRRQLLAAATKVPAPAPFARSAQLLRASLVTALSDDVAIENWIKATYNGDTASAKSYWVRHLRLATEASAAQATFLSVYNATRHRLFGLPALHVAY